MLEFRMFVHRPVISRRTIHALQEEEDGGRTTLLGLFNDLHVLWLVMGEFIGVGSILDESCDVVDWLTFQSVGLYRPQQMFQIING